MVFLPEPDDDFERDPFLGANYLSMIEGMGYVYVTHGATRKLAIKDAVEMWDRIHPHRIPEKIETRLEKFVD